LLLNDAHVGQELVEVEGIVIECFREGDDAAKTYLDESRALPIRVRGALRTV
jgi:hypothetical protein